jgi:adenine-specific DNA-methyltransferase
VPKLVSDNRIWFGKDGKTRPRLKLFLSESKGTPSWTWWANEEVGHNQEATKELNALMGMGEVFDNPKPTRLIKRILQLSTFNENSDIVLDFFAGSGTTAQAVMELNKEDGGNRQFILVQLPEKTDEESEAHKAGYKTIADICKERIRRAGRKMSEPLITQMAADNADKKKRQLTMELTASSADKESAASDSSKLSAVGFKVFTLQPSNFKVWRTDTIENGDDLNRQMDAFADPVRAGSDADAMAWEILVKSGYELTTKMEKLKLGVATQSGAKNTPTMSLPHDSSGNPAVPRDGFPIGAFGNDSTVSSERGQNNSVPMYSIAGGEVILALEKISQKAIDDVVKMKPKKFICLDWLFAGNDQLKTNTALQLRDAGVEFKTV